MSERHELRVLDAARKVGDDINGLLKSRRLPNAAQLRGAAESIASNIKEAFGRDPGADRNQFLRYARGSAEETNDRLRFRFAAADISPKIYWPLHHRLVTIARMLTNLMSDRDDGDQQLDNPSS
jgi:four helix bundle protein